MTVLKNPSIVINSVDLTSYIDTVNIQEKYADVDTTTFGNNSKTRVPGLGDHAVTLNFLQNFGAAAVEATIGPLVNGTTNVVIKATSSATSSTNPVYSMVCSVIDWSPINGKVGDRLDVSCTWPVSGDITKATS